MSSYNLFTLLILAAIFGLVIGNPCWSIPPRERTWEFIPCESEINTADPVARVFNGRLYVYTSWDDKNACGKRWNLKKEGTPDNREEESSFCMQGTVSASASPRNSYLRIF